MNNHTRDVNGLDLGILCSSDVRELNNFFEVRNYGQNWVSGMVCCLLDDFLVLEKLVGNQMTVFFLEASEHVCHGVIDGVCCVTADILKIRFLDRGNDLLHENLLDSRHFLKYTHFLGVRNLHVRINMGGCAIRDDKWTCESRTKKGVCEMSTYCA